MAVNEPKVIFPSVNSSRVNFVRLLYSPGIVQSFEPEASPGRLDTHRAYQPRGGVETPHLFPGTGFGVSRSSWLICGHWLKVELIAIGFSAKELLSVSPLPLACSSDGG